MSAAEQAAFTQERNITVVGIQTSPEPEIPTVNDPAKKDIVERQAQKNEDSEHPQYDSLKAVGYLLFNVKPLTGLLISFLNGFMVSGKLLHYRRLAWPDFIWLQGFYNTALILHLNDRYGLDATAAGLVYFAVAIPGGCCSPLSVSALNLRVVVYIATANYILVHLGLSDR
jgi:hypothetical protein